MNNSIAKYNLKKSIISFDDLSNNKYNSITHTNQLFTLMICQAIKITQFAILAPHSFKQKNSQIIYVIDSIAKYKLIKSIIYFDDLLSNKHHSITQIN